MFVSVLVCVVSLYVCVSQCVAVSVAV